MVENGREEKKEGGGGIVKDSEGVKDRRKTRRERQNVFGDISAPPRKSRRVH